MCVLGVNSQMKKIDSGCACVSQSTMLRTGLAEIAPQLMIILIIDLSLNCFSL